MSFCYHVYQKFSVHLKLCHSTFVPWWTANAGSSGCCVTERINSTCGSISFLAPVSLTRPTSQCLSTANKNLLSFPCLTITQLPISHLDGGLHLDPLSGFLHPGHSKTQRSRPIFHLKKCRSHQHQVVTIAKRTLDNCVIHVFLLAAIIKGKGSNQ